MSTSTPVLQLVKPVDAENVDIDILNDNMDKIEAAVGAAWTAYTPVWIANAVNIPLGASSWARYKQMGKTVFVQMYLVSNGAQPAGSDWTWTLPVPPLGHAAGITPLGDAMATSNNASWAIVGQMVLTAGVTSVMKIFRPATGTIASAIIAVGDQMTATLCYEAA